jgi:hypothetical protein
MCETLIERVETRKPLVSKWRGFLLVHNFLLAQKKELFLWDTVISMGR